MIINLIILEVRLDVGVSHKDDGPGPRSLYSVIYRKYEFKLSDVSGAKVRSTSYSNDLSYPTRRALFSCPFNTCGLSLSMSFVQRPEFYDF